MGFSAALLALFAVTVHAQIPAERQENCGSIISSVISVCSHPTLSRPDWCCNELIKWNNARCWCEPSAFDALDAVASSGNAYSFRDGFCPEAFYRPARGTIRPEYATCPVFDSVPETDASEGCTIAPAELRTQRLAALESLRTDSVQNVADLGPWFLRLDALFTEEAQFEMVGLFLAHGRFEVKQYFMTRQGVYNFLPMTSVETANQFWRNPSTVSYSATSTVPEGTFLQQHFVSFETCSARIDKFYIVDDQYQQRYGQFWDPTASPLVARYAQTSAQWCRLVRERCIGENYPFSSNADCRKFYNELKDNGQVTCNKFSQAYVPQYAVHGNILACRSFYLDLAVVEAAGACPAVGRMSSQTRCAESQCAGAAFIDPAVHNAGDPQFEEVPALTCSATECTENWPSSEQIALIPEEERSKYVNADGFTVTDSTTPVVAAGA
ncbi:hypothetical protein FGB62_32g021 [Gracilaria domingensis]|nr:hypothetical protein FGB62_32g021 [Gracilaria domingensis]